MLLLEIISGTFDDLKWLDNDRCEFAVDGQQYGVFFEDLDLDLEERRLKLMNVAFGTLNGPYNNIDDLDLSLTNLGRGPTVLNAVASAVLGRRGIEAIDIVVFGGADSHGQKRANVYRLAASKLKHKLGLKYITRVNTSNNEALTILMRDELTNDEVQFVLDHLDLHK